MCGICGVVSKRGRPIEISILEDMTSAMERRGPDSSGYFVDRNVGLGFRRLAIIDLDSGDQPLFNEDKTIALVLNGEIYNYKELRKTLKGLGHEFQSNSDAEVVIHLYEEYGEDCVQYLNGMFAFAIYDKRRSRVILGRDRLGIKPLYYLNNDDEVCFASDARSLIVNRRPNINDKGLTEYLVNGYTNSNSIFEGIEKLTPGCVLSIESSSIKRSRYWKLNRYADSDLSETESVEMLEELLNDSVRLQLNSDVPVGVFLSGGVDSSGITGLAAQLHGCRLNTYSIDYEGKAGEDAKYADIVAKKFNTNHHSFVVGQTELLSEVQDLIAHMDEPISDSAIFSTYLLSKYARANGVKVLLSGAGGDEIFGGYTRYKTLPVSNRAGLRDKIVNLNLDKIIPTKSTFGLIPERMKSPQKYYAAQISRVDLGFLSKTLKKDFYNDYIEKTIDEQYASIQREVPKYGGAYAKMNNDIHNYLVSNILALTDKATMATSVEARVPLLDHRIVELALSLNPSVNMLGNAEKGLFKKVLEKLIPHDVLWRRKEGFNAPLNSWMLEDNSTELIDVILDDETGLLGEFFNLSKLKEAILAPGKLRQSFQTVFSLYVLTRWHRSLEVTQ